MTIICRDEAGFSLLRLSRYESSRDMKNNASSRSLTYVVHRSSEQLNPVAPAVLPVRGGTLPSLVSVLQGQVASRAHGDQWGERGV